VLELVALIDAAKAGDDARVGQILANQPALASQRLPSGESPLMAALYRGHQQTVARLIELGVELDVFAAAATGSIGPLERALRNPAVVNGVAYDGWTPLHLAAFFGQIDAARLLLDRGADPTAVSNNGLRNTPLHAAVAGKHQDVALLLLERGADPGSQDAGGFTAAAIASENELHRVVAQIRVQGGASGRG
jgi:ankyrin repeat protein